ncbi:hypothetical protein B4U80_02046 [Leptotrombidium deliense]|uniref:Peptidase S1 domain-containing protein n=1 Tax=Leptotrombidium deliense TaxID=299467 RepID=A0A443RZ28_9ACAR|nr:hypothetical protein B4U80_02046 [Leptotrombidium deliense]
MQRWWAHNNYNACDKKFKNDIAIIKFSDSLKLPTLTNNGYGSINTACHPNKNTHGNQATLSGWGRFNTNNNQNSKVLRTVNVPVWSLSDCKNKWDVDDSQICAGGNAGENSCMGDSGGPLVTYYNKVAYVIGLSSYGPNQCAQKGIPNVFTKVSYFNDWINNIVNNN